MDRFKLWYQGLPRVLRTILTVNTVIYALYLLVFQWSGVLSAAAFRFLALDPTPGGVASAPWTLLTYGVTHLGGGVMGFLSFLFNMLILFWVGEEMERMLGGAWLLMAYVFATLGGALAAVAFAAAMGTAFPVFGAHAAVLGVMATVAVRYPYKTISLFLIGTVKLLYVVIGFLVLALLLSGPFYFALELGGVLAAALYGVAEKRGLDLHTWAAPLAGERRRAAPRRAAEPRAQKVRTPWQRAGAEVEVAAPPRTQKRARATQAEVDRILDKISAEGKASLTADERRILDEYSRR